MVEFNQKRATQHLEALGYPAPFIELELEAISNIHADLQGIFDAWMQGVEEEFAFKGVSLSQIKEREGCDHLNAICTMSMFIKRPETIESFLAVSPETFRRQCGGRQAGPA